MSGNSTTSVIIVLLVVVVLTAGMIITLETRVDNVSQQEAQKMVEDFVADVANTGTLTKSQYQTFQSQLNAKTGKNCDIELEAQILDENPGKKTAQANYTKIGENVYYSDYTTQVLQQLQNDSKKICLKQGDRIVVDVKNTNNTQAQTLKGSLLSFTNAGQYTISASSTGMINVNGK